MEESKFDKLDALREHITHLFAETDRRYEQRFNDQKEAIVKAEEATERRFEGVNEFRQTLSDQAATFISRTEVVQHFKSLDAKVDAVTGRMDRLEGRDGGSRATWAYAIAGIGLIGTIVGIVGTIAAVVVILTRNR